MPKTPDEIKKGLECCTSRDCGGNKCPYFNEKSCNAAKSTDALAYIRQLEAELDALIEQARENDICVLCKYKDVPCDAEPCVSCCAGGLRFEWHGVQKGDSDA